VRSTGMYSWGERLDDTSLKDKARRIVNLALSAPQHDGIFPSLLDLQSHHWIGTLWQPPDVGYRSGPHWRLLELETDPMARINGSGQRNGRVSDAVSAECEDNPRILPYVKALWRFSPRPCAAQRLRPRLVQSGIEATASLRFNADGGAHIWVLAEFGPGRRKTDVSRRCRRCRLLCSAEILPQQKWSDSASTQMWAPPSALKRRLGSGFNSGLNQAGTQPLGCTWARRKSPYASRTAGCGVVLALPPILHQIPGRYAGPLPFDTCHWSVSNSNRRQCGPDRSPHRAAAKSVPIQ